MIRQGWRVAEMVGQLLAPNERIAVLGDLAESECSVGTALAELLGLIARRQIDEWRRWQPWAALLGVAGIAGYELSRWTAQFDLALSLQVRTYWKYGVHYRQGVNTAQDVVSLTCMFLALVIWSRTSGFLLAALSHRSMWLTGPSFYAVVATFLPLSNVLNGNTAVTQSPSLLIVLLHFLLPLSAGKSCFLAAASIGAIAGCQSKSLYSKHSTAWATMGLCLIGLLLWTGNWYEAARETWSNGVWHATPWTQRVVPLLVMSWPLAYLLGTSRSVRRKSQLQHASA